MRRDVLHDQNWEQVRRFLPFDLDGLALQTGAMRRRRGVADGATLLRLLLMCGLPGASFERVAGWALESGLARMNGSAVFFRLRDSEEFLSSVFASLLGYAACRGQNPGEDRLIAVDATTLCGPGATGVDFRLHVVYDLETALPRSVELTTAKGGEAFSRHLLPPGSLVLGDRGYAHAKGILWALRGGASVLVRFEFSFLRLLDLRDQPISSLSAARLVPDSGSFEMPVRLPGWEEPLRAIGTRNPQGEVVWLLTDLSQSKLAAASARETYSRRWQIELFFKRLKSLLDIDELPTRDGPTARPWVWAKLILAALAALATDERFSPWGCPPERMEEVCQRRVASSTSASWPMPSLQKSAPTQTNSRTATQAICLVEA